MAEFRIDQPGGAGSGVAGESRVDLLPGFVVELHATPVAGATFTWEILDKVNAPVAFLTGTTGLTVNIGSAGVDIPAFCGFMVRLTQNLLGVITVQDRVAAVRSAVAQIRPPLFGEQSPSVQTLNANNPALSTDNAVYPDLAGLGVPGNNPFGWREWAWEIAKALETTAAVVGTPAPIKISGASRQILSIIGSETVIGSFGAFDPTVYADPVLLLEATFVFVPATAGSIEVRLYDMGTRLSPGAGILRSTITATFADVGVLKCISQTLAVTPGPGVNVDEIDPSEVIYEVRAILIGANPGDELELGAVHLVVAPSIGGGGMAAPNSPSFLTLGAAAGLLAERVFTPQKSVVGIDGGAGAAYAVELDGDVAAPGNDMAYSTDGTGAKGWFPKAASDVIWSPSNPSPGPGVYTAWADLYAAVNAVPYALRVVTCDGSWNSLDLPPGTWDLQGWTFVGAPEGDQPYIAIQDGAYVTTTTDPNYGSVLSFDNVYVEYQGTTAPCIAINNNDVRIFLTDAEIDAVNGWPFVAGVSAFVSAVIRGSSYFWAPNGDQGVLNGDFDSYVVVYVLPDAVYGDSQGSYAGAAYLGITNTSLASSIEGLSGGTYPQHSGPTNFTNDTDSRYLKYDDGVAPVLGATDVQGALDAIKPLLGGASLTNTAPVDATKAAADVGVATDAARSDHKHDVATAAPSSVGNANAEGSSSSLARADHVHDHGNLSGGALHAVAVAGVSDGFISAASQTKLDGVASSATNTPLTASSPANVTKAAAAVGVSTDAARADHKHDITTAAPSSVGTSNAEGSSSSLARADHVHGHGNQTSGTLHAAADYVTAGFMTAAMRGELNRWTQQWPYPDTIGTTYALMQSQIFLKEDFMCIDALHGFKSAFSGAGAGVVASQATGRVGIAWYQTGSTAAGRAGFLTDPNIVKGGVGSVLRGRIDMRKIFASNAGDRYTLRVGFMDTLNGDSLNGYYFRYTDNVNGGLWECVVRDNGAETAVDSGLSTGSAYSGFEVVVQGYTADFYLGGSLVYSDTNGVFANRYGFGVSINKSIGVNPSDFEVDLAYLAFNGGVTY